MCGFTGVADLNRNAPQWEERVAEAASRIQHRGPDAAGTLTNDFTTLAHRRLSIIDLDPRANQPMSSPCGRYVLVYNGEVYNYRELKNDLIRKEHVFATESDTEVVLHQMMAYGAAGIAALNGCFAFAFIDLEERSVLLVRDRFGINPLWYTIENESTLVFASEGKGLPLQRQAINRNAIADILRFSYNPENHTALQNIHRLPPGCYLEWPNDKQPKTWFSPIDEEREQPVKSLREALETAVNMRLIADVPVGCFLSGGIDSSIVSALAARHHSGINTFSVGFERYKQLDESDAAEAVAKHIGSQHHCFQMTDEDLHRHADLLLQHSDEPFADSSAIAASFLAEKTAGHVKVALSGDGADELLGGYRKHRAHALYAGRSRFTRHTMIGVIHLLSRLLGPGRGNAFRKLASVGPLSPAERYFALARFSSKEDAFAVFPHTSAEGENQKTIRTLFDRYPEKRAVLYADQLMVLPNDMLTKVDLTSMRHSLEVRVPFLDPLVVRAVQAIHVDNRYTAQTGKLPLQAQFSDLLPPAVFAKRKMGFEVPLSHLLRSPLRDRLDRLQKSEYLAEMGIVANAVAAISLRFVQGEERLATLIWTLMQIDAWLERQTNGFQ